MGYFQLLKELDAANEQQAAEAAALAERASDDLESMIETAWVRVEDPGFVAKLYEQLTPLDAHLKLAHGRVLAAVNGAPEQHRALAEGGLGGAGPMLASLLFTDRKRGAARLLPDVYSQFGRPLTKTLSELSGGSDDVAFFALLTLSTSPFEQERKLALELRAKSQLPQAWLDALSNRIALAGGEGEDAWLVDQLRNAAQDLVDAPERAVASGEKRYLRREENSPAAGWCMAAGERKLAEAVEPLCGLLYSFDALEALDALAEIGDASALDAVRAYRSSLGGGALETLPFRLAADNALAALGEDVSADSARELFEQLYPKRYGYPKMEHLVAHWVRGVAAYADRGDEEQLRYACSFVGAPWSHMRAAAAKAWQRLHGELPQVSYWDMTRVEQVFEASGAETLLDALDEPTAAYRYLIVEYLLEHGDDATQLRVADWIARQFEARINFYVDGADRLPDDAKAMVRALRDCDNDAIADALAGSESAWIQTFVLGGDEMEKPSIYATPTDPMEVEIEGFGTAPFVYGKHINGLAVSPDRTRLGVVGESFGRLDDLATGDEAAYLDLRWNWGYDCEFSPDGSKFAVCFHGGHVEIFDAATGERLFDELVGHGGVPNGVKRLAFSSDGQWLVTVGQDARVICWNAETGEQRWAYQATPGSYEAVTWTPDGKRIVASHVKTSGGEKNFLSIHDAATGEAELHELEHSMWALRYSPDGKRLAMGGEANAAHLCDPKDFSVKRELALGATTQLEFSPDGEFIYGCSNAGELKRWKSKGRAKKGETLLSDAGPLWALDVDSSGAVRVIGTKGELHTFVDGEPADGPEAFVHTKQIKGFARVNDSLITASWDGQVLRWPLDGGKAEQVFALQRRINRMALIGDDQVALATGDGLRVVDLSSGEVVRETEDDLDAVAVSADGKQIAIDSRSVLQILDGDTVTEVTVGSDSISRIAALADGWLAGTDAGELSLVRDGKRIWTIADHGADRLEFGSPHKDICDIVVFDGGFITAGNDNTIRAYDWAGGDARPRLRLRLHTYTGIFNAMSVSPNGKMLAAPSSGSLQIYDLEDGSTLLSLPTLEHFGHNSLTVPHFLDDHTILIGTETGRYFRVTLGGEQ